MSRMGIGTLFLLAPLASCGPLPDQNTIPPNVRLTFFSGSQNNSVDQTTGLPVQHIDPNLPVSVIAEAWSSLAGLQSIELDPDEGFTCTQGEVARNGDLTQVPSVVTAPASPPNLHLTTEIDAGPPAQWCQPGWTLYWSGSFVMKAKSNNGLSTTSKQLNLVSP